MTKKGYQTRLPKVLPPTVPPPRTSDESDPPAAASGPAPVAAPDPVVPDPVVPDPVLPDPVMPDPVAPDPAVHTSPTEPSPIERRRSPAVLVAFALIGLVNLVVVGLILYAIFGADEEDGPAAKPGDGAAPAPRLMPTDESYVETVAQSNGDLVVHQWIRADEPIGRLRLALPTVPGAEDLSATRIEVEADGVVVDGANGITGRARTYTFEETTDVEVTYRLRGAVELSDSAPGRALALTTALDVTYSPRTEHETRVVRAAEVLALACTLSPQQSPVPCGTDDGAGQWSVELDGPMVDARVVAQLTLG